MHIRYFFPVLTAFILPFTLSAGSPSPARHKCATDIYWNQLEAKYPQLKDEMSSMEKTLFQLEREKKYARYSNSIITIPVVVHVVYRTSLQNISNAQIQSQIDVLNEDFARLNADTINTPIPFRSVASSTQFRFCLAQRDPDNNPTTGIERRQTTITSFSTDNAVKYDSTGGMNAWDINRYLNIWVCNLSGGVLGYGEFPNSLGYHSYGLVVQYNAFGRVGTLQPVYNLGRTAVHEISHCFLLKHIWGDDSGACSPTASSGDNCPDTPDQASETYGCLSFPHFDNCTSSGNGIMFMNYMDYSDDNCLNMFTLNQSSRMNNAMFAFKPQLLNSNGCVPVTTGISELDQVFDFSVYPNPSEGLVNLDLYLMPSVIGDLQLKVYDRIGQVVMDRPLQQPAGQIHQLDFSSLADGVYFLNLSNKEVNRTVRFVLAR